MSLFPAHIERDIALKSRKRRGIPREYEIDFETGQLTGRIVEGKEAIRVWIWLAMKIPRYRYYVYTWDYGNEYEDLIGQSYTEEYTETEARRMTEDCLLIHEEIQKISDFKTAMTGSALTAAFTAETIYGGLEVRGQDIAKATARGRNNDIP